MYFLKRIYLFFERGREGERGEKYQCVREAAISCLLHMPWTGAEPTIQACVLTRNGTGNISSHGMMFNQQSHTSKGSVYVHPISLYKQYIQKIFKTRLYCNIVFLKWPFCLIYFVNISLVLLMVFYNITFKWLLIVCFRDIQNIQWYIDSYLE